MLTALPRMVRANAPIRIVIVGGGIGGATVAKYLATSGASVSTTLIEPQKNYTTGIFSNLYLAGARSLASLTFSYEELTGRYGVAVRHDRATAIDPDARRVRLESGESVAYDRLILSPGIAFRSTSIEGYDDVAMVSMPHAWTDGAQMELLRGQLEAMDDGGTFVIAAPPAPYRCPRGPYERASMVAYYFRQFKPRAKVLILDAESDFVDRELFQDGWQRHYRGQIEWQSVGKTGWVKGVDPKARSVRLADTTVKADVANIIPPQSAGSLASAANLVDRTGWCPVDPSTFESKRQRGIYVVGDAALADDMPKTGFSTNSQAKACAFAILAELSGTKFATPHLLDASFTFLAGDDVTSALTSFKAIGTKLQMENHVRGEVGEDPDRRRKNVRDANRWYGDFMHDVLG